MSPESDPAHRNVHQAVQEHYTATARARIVKPKSPNVS